MSPGHDHTPRDFGRAFAIGVGLNLLVVAMEALFGVLSNSMALLANAGHNLTDVLGLLLAWSAMVLVKRPATARYTYGLRASSILAALANAVILMIAGGAIAWEAVQRLEAPQPMAETTVMVVAGVGAVVNLGTGLLFMAGRHTDLNVRGAFLHMMSDAAVSAGVVAGGIVILLTGWLWVDSIISLAIVALIGWSNWALLRDSVRLSLHAVPPGIDAAAVRDYLQDLPGVSNVHDLHIWAMSTTQTALSCHLVMSDGKANDSFLATKSQTLHERFEMEHMTVQVEQGRLAFCLQNKSQSITRPAA